MVLCAYLGQLAHVRDALATEVAIVIDERDQMALAEQEDEKEDKVDFSSSVEHVKVSKRVGVPVFFSRTKLMDYFQVRLRTVDNYQGEEAKVNLLFSFP